MSSPAKKVKNDETEENKDFDSATQKALEEIDSCQNQIDTLNEKASEDILKVEQKFNKLRKPFFEKRNDIIKRIPTFWVTAFVNHPQITNIIDEDEEDCLHYLTKLEVDEFEDIKFGYKINFHFEENPYLENTVLTKEFHLGAPVPCSKSTPIRWKEGHDLVKQIKDRDSEKQGRKRSFETRTFFTWYLENCDPSTDEIAEVIKDDVWPNPLQYYLVPDIDVDANGMALDDDDEEDASTSDGDDEDEDASDDEADDSVVVVEEVEEEDEDNDDDDDEENDEEEQVIEDQDNTGGEEEGPGEVVIEEGEVEGDEEIDEEGGEAAAKEAESK